jgi:hypothetical protein
MFSQHRQQLKYLRAWSRFESYIQNPQSTAYIALSDIERQRFFDAHFGWNWVTEQLRRELEQVSDLAVFREFDVKNRMENIKLLENATSSIKSAAPHLSKVLRLLDHPHWAKDKSEEVQLPPRHLLMFSITCTSLVLAEREYEARWGPGLERPKKKKQFLHQTPQCFDATDPRAEFLLC